MEKYFVLPFSIGCSSQASVDVVSPSDQLRKIESETKHSGTRSQEGEEGKMKKTSRLPNISGGIQKLLRSILNLSHLFVYKKDDEPADQQEMVIGFPTDVKHVTHIGLDGTTTTNNLIDGCNNDNFKAPEIIPLPSFSLKQFELAMASQSQRHRISLQSLLH
ncbi:hypothetical protein ACFE04_012750 [Oxalis oulophora]